MQDIIQSKRFVVRQSLIGKDAIIKVEFKNGKTVTYSHDKAFSLMQESLEQMACWLKYKSYTATSSIPKVLRDTDAIIEVTLPDDAETAK